VSGGNHKTNVSGTDKKEIAETLVPSSAADFISCLAYAGGSLWIARRTVLRLATELLHLPGKQAGVVLPNRARSFCGEIQKKPVSRETFSARLWITYIAARHSAAN
jgi:hypothetical protein